MDRENVISGLQYTKEMFLFDPATGYTKDPDDLNAIDRITFDACVGAIALLKSQQAEIEQLKAQKQKWIQNIADQQLAASPTGYETEEELAKRTGEWNGLQMAWEILTEGR